MPRDENGQKGAGGTSDEPRQNPGLDERIDLPRLRKLDVSKGTMTDEGASGLRSLPSVANLECVDVSENLIERTTGLAGLARRVSLGQQRAAEGPGRRYVSIGE